MNNFDKIIEERSFLTFEFPYFFLPTVGSLQMWNEFSKVKTFYNQIHHPQQLHICSSLFTVASSSNWSCDSPFRGRVFPWGLLFVFNNYFINVKYCNFCKRPNRSNLAKFKDFGRVVQDWIRFEILLSPKLFPMTNWIRGSILRESN